MGLLKRKPSGPRPLPMHVLLHLDFAKAPTPERYGPPIPERPQDEDIEYLVNRIKDLLWVLDDPKFSQGEAWLVFKDAKEYSGRWGRLADAGLYPGASGPFANGFANLTAGILAAQPAPIEAGVAEIRATMAKYM